MQESCTALVAVDSLDNAPLPMFRVKHRNFRIGDQLDISIEQDWNKHGVAGVVWRAGLVLSNLLISQPGLVEDKRVVELGAGTAIPSMTAAFLGARQVIATDLASNLQILQANIDINQRSYKNADWWAKVEIKALHWGQHDNNEFAALQGKMDVILGADIVYIEETFQDLLTTLLYLSHDDTIILLACKIRYDRDNDFITLLKTKFMCKVLLTDKEDDSVVVYSCSKIKQ